MILFTLLAARIAEAVGQSFTDESADQTLGLFLTYVVVRVVALD